MSQRAKFDVAIVGAGAAGVLLANALVRPLARLDVALIDPQPGRGLAYGLGADENLLNTRVGNMSLDGGAPSGFLDWLETYAPRPQGWDEEDFAPRRLFGDYLEQRLRNLENRTPGLGVTRVVHARATAAEQSDEGWSIALPAGERLLADVLVLATGPSRPRPLLFHGRETIDGVVRDDPWDPAAVQDLPPGATVLLVGTGLTALDTAAAIWRRNPEAKLIAVSRHGMLPREHGSPPATAPVLKPPYPRTARELYAKLRAAAEFVEGDAAMRHGVFLGLREIAAELWANMPDDERLMFLRHFRRYWDVERHRAPPAQAEVIRAAMTAGRLEIVRGRVAEARPAASGARVALLTNEGPRALVAHRVINCTGPESDPFRSRNPLLLDLLAQGTAAADPLGLGLHVDGDSAVLRSGGVAATGLYAMGVLTQGRFFEITAMAEIRAQAERLSALILERIGQRERPPGPMLAANRA